MNTRDCSSIGLTMKSDADHYGNCRDYCASLKMSCDFSIDFVSSLQLRKTCCSIYDNKRVHLDNDVVVSLIYGFLIGCMFVCVLKKARNRVLKIDNSC